MTCLDIVNETIKNGYHFVGDTCVGMDLRLLSQISLTKLLRMVIALLEIPVSGWTVTCLDYVRYR